MVRRPRPPTGGAAISYGHGPPLTRIYDGPVYRGTLLLLSCQVIALQSYCALLFDLVLVHSRKSLVPAKQNKKYDLLKNREREKTRTWIKQDLV